VATSPARLRVRMLGTFGALALAAVGVSACGAAGGNHAASAPPVVTAASPAASAAPATSPPTMVNDPAQLVLRPPIGQDAGGHQLMPGVASFQPAKPGAKVTVERSSDGEKWTTATTGEQDKDGEFVFQVSASSGTNAPSYRATSDSGNGPITTGSVSSSPWKLVWGDDFDGTSLGSDWTVLPTGAYAGRTCASATADMGTVHDGYAVIGVAHDPSTTPAVSGKICPSGKYFNAQFGTQNSHTFTYGVLAARLKYEHAEGMHASFWMLPGGTGPANPAPDNPAQTGVEVDITEYFGDDFGAGVGNGDYHAYVYWPQRQANGAITSVKTGGAQDFKKYYPGSMPSDGYHVYSVEWTPTQYIFRLDGVETSRLTVGVSQRPEYLLLSLLTSDWEVPKLTAGQVPASMSVDWVRAWQQ
jgi:beta-glucanase (GH16 family)